MNKLNTETQLPQTIVSGSLFSEMNTEMLKISVAIQNIKQSEFIEDYKQIKYGYYLFALNSILIIIEAKRVMNRKNYR